MLNSPRSSSLISLAACMPSSLRLRSINRLLAAAARSSADCAQPMVRIASTQNVLKVVWYRPNEWPNTCGGRSLTKINKVTTNQICCFQFSFQLLFPINHDVFIYTFFSFSLFTNWTLLHCWARREFTFCYLDLHLSSKWHNPVLQLNLCAFVDKQLRNPCRLPGQDNPDTIVAHADAVRNESTNPNSNPE